MASSPKTSTIGNSATNSHTHTEDDSPSDTATIVAPLGLHTHTVIFLHGREDFGEDLAQYFFDSRASDGNSLAEIFPSIRWVFPTANLRYSAQRDFKFSKSSFAEVLKGEEVISQWFDVWDIKVPDSKQELMLPGLQESIQHINNIIQEEANTVPLGKIILGGISQGRGGFIGLSSWLPFQSIIEAIPPGKNRISPHIQDILQMSRDKNTTEVILSASEGVCQQSAGKTPVFLAHSWDVETVPFTHGQGLHQSIKNLGFDVTWKEYRDGGHWIHSKHGVDDISAFLHKIINI
ncbi:hypothetical protein BP6252_07304 [Coleophoma cylindrospora]|uniref:Phospholipase/carboxylesterase/thioesterase domain-containing protein n=1 Tax=Coleophoma cylindrospora TaxID=1849047 RepID=A0A3D8RH90_9HELO|nr:hypothetical protein BP6252_07304 [Coleophoma cylindrospora]